MQLIGFFGRGICGGRGMQLIPAFLAAYLGKLPRCGYIIMWKRSGGRAVFFGEDGFIIKENFGFVKNGKKGGQKGQEGKILYVKHKEF